MQNQVGNQEITFEVNGYKGTVNDPADVNKITEIIKKFPDSICPAGAFSHCSSLTQIIIPSNVTSIGSSPFYSCLSLRQITIPYNVKFHGFLSKCSYLNFYNCNSLSNVTISISSNITSNDYIKFFALISKLKSNLKQTVSIELETEDHKIPFKLDALKMAYTNNTNISDFLSWASNNCFDLTKFIIPGTVTSIEDSAFRDCKSLTQITIPSSVTSIEDSAFVNCSSLTQITIPSNVTSIGGDAFYNCSSLRQITIPYNVIFNRYPFGDCNSLSNVTISISSNITSNDYIKFFALISKLKSNLEQTVSIELEAEDHKIPFKLDALKAAYTNNTNISDFLSWASNNCFDLTKFRIPNNVNIIHDYAFEGCSSLTQITIPSSVTSIGYDAFSRCDNLSEINLPASFGLKYNKAYYYVYWNLPTNTTINFGQPIQSLSARMRNATINAAEINASNASNFPSQNQKPPENTI